MRFVDHPASSALARDAEAAGAVGARRVHVVIDQRARRVTDPEAGADEARRHLGLLFMAGRSRPQAFVEKAYARKRGRAKSHVRAQHSAHLDDLLAVINDRQVEPYRGVRTDLGRRILGRQDAPLHRGELGMFREKPLDLGEIVRRDDEVIVKTYDYVAFGMADGHVLDSAFAGTRVVQMRERRRRRGQYRRRGHAVFG